MRTPAGSTTRAAGGHDGEAVAPKGQGAKRRSDKPRSGLHGEAARRARPRRGRVNPPLSEPNERLSLFRGCIHSAQLAPRPTSARFGEDLHRSILSSN